MNGDVIKEGAGAKKLRSWGSCETIPLIELECEHNAICCAAALSLMKAGHLNLGTPQALTFTQYEESAL